MEGSKFYWIKLRTDFFADDSPMDALLSMPNGSEYVCLYLKLCLQTANKGGRLCSQFGEMLIPYDAVKIANDMKHFSIDTVRVAMEIYAKMGLIYTESDGVLAITNHAAMVGSESASREACKKRAQRAKKLIEASQCGTLLGTQVGTNCPTEIRDKEIRDIDIRDKDIRDKDLDIEIDGSTKRKRFTKPTIEEVEAYINDKNLSVNAQRWFDYYESNGWKVGRNPMKDWKACIRTWASKDKKQEPQSVYDKWANA